MNDIFEEGLPSPTGAPNFLIGFSEELDLIGNSNIQTDNFVKFVNTLNCPQSEVFSVTDKSFIPRAFTDFELFVEEKSMNEQNLSALGNSFQPDVIMSNSQQRSGPDGSPALIPSASKRFAARSNLSDTGELFAPVKTLTFSDIDQSSHIEDSYVNDSRLVSTPNKKSVYGNMQNDSYDYNCMTNNRFQTIENRENHGGGNSDSSDSDNGLNGRGDTVTPEFRQLDGEDEEELANTGPFHPSTHGLSKEFMDNFVGKTGNQEAISANCDIFSPLGSKFHIQDRRLDSKTPPLHSPGQISPYTKSFKSPRSQKSPRYQQSPRQRPSPKGQDENKTDPDEIQFAMSPSKDIAYSRSLQEGFTVRNTGEKFYYGSNRNEYNFISRENVGHSLNQANVPKNLDEYFEQVTSDRFIAQRFNPSHPEYYGEGDELASRQGDGLDNEFNDTHQQPLPPPDSETRNPDLASLPLDTKYLQKTQVSVKLPQATYDTISANTSHDERFATGDRMYSNYPDVAMSGPGETDQPENTLEHNEVERTDTSQGQFNENLSQTGSSKQIDGNELRDGSSRLNNDQSKPSDLNDKALKFDSKFDTKESVTKPVSSLKSSESHTSPKTSEHFQTATGQERLIQSASGKSNDTNISGPDEGNPASQSQVSSRLFQETVSQRNKTTQKFVSSAPPLSKPYSTQVRDFKKPFEPNTKNNNVSYSGAKKPGTTATNSDMKKSSNEPCPRFKASDRTKPKSASNDSLNQKTTKFGGNLQRNSQNSGENSTQPRSYHQPTSTSGQGQLSRGQFNSKGQGHTGVNGEVHNSSMHSDDEGHIQGHPRIVTQVENTSPVAVERPSQSTNVRQTSQLADSSLDIKGMEEVRHQLQSMMKMSHEHMAPHDRSQYEHSDIIAGFGVEFGEQQQHHQRPMEKSWNMLRNPGEDDIMENFPSFSSQYFTDSGNVSRSDNSLHAENQRLRDMLEKERYRRKHCEQYIQQLNVKLLETQQQVAVAVSTDKRKDLMIEQLDKQLARVMEGWKKRDQEKDDMMADIQKEKEEIENNMKQQQQMISNFEHDMSEAVDALRQEKEKAGKDIEELKQEIENKDHARQHVEELLDAEKEKSDLLQQECENLREGRETLDKKLDQMQKRLHREQDEWFQREQELLQRIDEVSEKTNRVLQTERAKNEEQGKLAEEIMEQYQTALTNVKKLEMELDAALREKESVKVEMGIMEAKFENAQRVLEADLSSTMEKRIASQISDVQKRHEAITDELQEKHREQMLELSKKNGQEMEKQLNIFREEMLKKEEDFRKQFQEMESSLTEYRNENAELKRSKQKLESTRYEVLTKLQYAMQSQWNEAFSMLTSATPQRQHTQSKTPGGEEEASSTLQGPPTVNFSFFTPSELSANQTSVFQPTNSNTSQVTNQTTPPRQTANPKTPPRQSTNRSSFESTLANQISPVPKHLTNQERVLISSPGGDSVISHSTERDPNDPLEPSIETATMSHLKQIQDYMNSFAKTPEWISSITSQADVHDPHNPMSQNSLNSQQVAPPSLTSSNEFASFLSTHLNSIQHQMTYPPSHMSSAANHVTSFHSLPNTEAVNHGQFESVSSFSLPNFHQIPNKQSMDPSKTESAAGNYPKSRNGKNMSESCHSQSETTLKLINQSEHSLFSSNNHSVSEVTGISRAIALHPPQQGTDPYSREDLDHSHTESSRGYFQGGQSFSPPTKQNKDSPSNSMEDLRNQSNKLNVEYSNLSERLEQHGSHQQELQHYIQMLLHRSPREETTTHDNDSMFSQDNEILDLNDTAQAAQLQQELDRIQQLREKQQTDISKSSNKSTTSTKHASHTEDHVQKKILTAEQLAEVTKLLNNVKGQGQGQPQSESPHVLELLELLKHVQLDKGNQSEVKRGTRPGPKGPSGSHGERHRPGASGVRRNVQFNPGKGVDHSKGQSQGQEVKSCQKNVQAKKVERKIAGSTTKGDKGPKPAAWK